jgi:hypothetical protein
VKLTKIQEQCLLAMYRGEPWTLAPITRRALLRLQLIAPPRPYALTELGRRVAAQLAPREARPEEECAGGSPVGTEPRDRRGSPVDSNGGSETRSRRGTP